MTEPHRSSELALAALVLQARSGDANALGQWYEHEFKSVWRLALGVLTNSTEAEDVAQETMLHLKSKLAAWDPSRPYAAWRNQIVINRCRDRLRKIKARQSAEIRAAGTLEPGQLPDPADQAQASETREILQSCLAALSPREREVFVLRDLEERDTREVALTLKVTESTVRSLSTYARRRMRAVLEQRFPNLALGFEGGPA